MVGRKIEKWEQGVIERKRREEVGFFEWERELKWMKGKREGVRWGGQREDGVWVLMERVWGGQEMGEEEFFGEGKRVE